MHNAKFNSIWTLVDNGDGIVQKDEIKMLKKLLKIADSSIQKTKGDKIIDNEELIALTKKIHDGTVTKELDSKTAARITQNLAKSAWSEGLDRKISKIQISLYEDDTESQKLISELKSIGQEAGFEVENLQMSSAAWIEDYGIRRSDGKMLFMSETTADNIAFELRYSEKTAEIQKNRENISKAGQGNAAVNYYIFQQKFEEKNTTLTGKSYLEGGNVLNTKLADGTPAAIVGEESIGYTLVAMDLENNEVWLFGCFGLVFLFSPSLWERVGVRVGPLGFGAPHRNFCCFYRGLGFNDRFFGW